MVQHPLNMGRPNNQSTSNALAVQLDHEGKVKYDVIARQGHDKNKVTFCQVVFIIRCIKW